MASDNEIDEKHIYQQCDRKPWIICLPSPPGGVAQPGRVVLLKYYCILCDEWDEDYMMSISDLYNLESRHWRVENSRTHATNFIAYGPTHFDDRRAERNEAKFHGHRDEWGERLLNRHLVPPDVVNLMMKNLARGLRYPANVVSTIERQGRMGPDSPIQIPHQIVLNCPVLRSVWKDGWTKGREATEARSAAKSREDQFL